MKNKIFILLIMLIPMISCNEQQQNKNKQEQPFTKDTTIVTKDLSQKNKIGDTLLDPNILRSGSDTLVIKLHINGIKEMKIISVSVESGKELFATITTNDTKANIRINQIEMPDSTFDGPFGDSLHYKIKIPGMYKIIIGENMMAEGNWSGNFTIKAWVK